MPYCQIHGSYSGDSGCWECQSAEKHLEEAANERAVSAARLAAKLSAGHTYKINNPGDFECPYCLLISLKRGARRCPKCQHDVETSYWQKVKEREVSTQDLKEKKEREEREKQRRFDKEMAEYDAQLDAWAVKIRPWFFSALAVLVLGIIVMVFLVVFRIVGFFANH